MKVRKTNENGERGGVRAAGVLWLLGVPLIAALLIGFLVCR